MIDLVHCVGSFGLHLFGVVLLCYLIVCAVLYLTLAFFYIRDRWPSWRRRWLE